MPQSRQGVAAKGGVAPRGREREACFTLAKDYVRFAKLIEAQQGTSIAEGLPGIHPEGRDAAYHASWLPQSGDRREILASGFVRRSIPRCGEAGTPRPTT